MRVRRKCVFFLTSAWPPQKVLMYRMALTLALRPITPFRKNENREAAICTKGKHMNICFLSLPCHTDKRRDTLPPRGAKDSLGLTLTRKRGYAHSPHINPHSHTKHISQKNAEKK